MILGPTAIEAVATYPELLGLLSLRQQARWQFLPLKDGDEVVMIVGARVWWIGWSDAIAIRDRGDAKAFRCNPDSGEVWSAEGSLADVLDALVDLPSPFHPNAPHLVKRTAPRLWLPAGLAVS